MTSAVSATLIIKLIAFTGPDSSPPRVGETVIVMRETDLYEGNRVLQRVHPGLPVVIDAEQNGRFWVVHEVAGWIDSDQVARPRDAISVFSERTRTNPDDPDSFAARAAALTVCGEFDAAIDDYSQIIRLQPDSSKAFCGRAVCWIRKNQVDRAIADCSEALRLDPADAVTLNNRANAWIRKCNFDAAIRDSNEALRLVPRLEAAYANRATAWAAKRDFALALADSEASHTINPRSGSTFNEVAWFLATCPQAEFRDGAKAIEFASRACEATNWRNPSNLDTLAAAHAENSNFEDAEHWAAKAVSLAPLSDKPEFEARRQLYGRGLPYREPRPE